MEPGPRISWPLGSGRCQLLPGWSWEGAGRGCFVSAVGWPLRSVSEPRARRGCRQEDLRLQIEEGRKEQREGRKQEGRRKAVMEGGEKEGGKGAREGGRRPVEILA